MATFDAHANLARGTVVTAPVPALTGTSLVVAAGEGALFPATPFNCTVYPNGQVPTVANAEIVRVTAVVGDTLTIVRAQEGSAAKAIAVGYQIANTTTVKVFTDIENAINANIQTISAGVDIATSNQIVFSNANGVSFGAAAGSVITASVNAGGAAGSLSAGASSIELGQVVFSNSNGVSFGLNGSTVTAAHDGITQQSTQPVAASASNGSFVFSTLGFSNANNVTFGTSAGGIITASVATAAAGNSVNFSAGTTSNNLGSIIFSNSNNVTFGLNGATITASASNAQSTQPVAASASNGSFAFQTLAFSNANNVTFGTSAGSIITASVAAAGPGGGGELISFRPESLRMLINDSISGHEVYFADLALPAGMSNGYVRLVLSATGTSSAATTIASASATANGGRVGTAEIFVYSFGTGASSDTLQLYAYSTAGVTCGNTISITNTTQASYTQAMSWPVRGVNSVFSTTYTANGSTYHLNTSFFANFSNVRFFDVPLNTSLTIGNYMVGFRLSTSITSAGAALPQITAGFIFPRSICVNSFFDWGRFVPGGTNDTIAQFGGGIFSSLGSLTSSSINTSQINSNGSQRKMYFELHT